MAWPWIAGVVAALAVAAGLVLRTVPAAVDAETAIARTEAIIAGAARALVVAAHPDDVEWYAGGALVRLLDAGADVTVVMATDGERGRGPKPGLAEIRRQEQVEAARRLGPVRMVFLGMPDGGLSRAAAAGELGERVREVWRQVDPDVVLTFDTEKPQLPYVHPDHMAAGAAAAAAWRELGSPAAMWLFHTRRPDVFVVFTAAAMQRKLDALAAHETQMASHGADLLLRAQGRRFGALVGVEYAEAYRDAGRAARA